MDILEKDVLWAFNFKVARFWLRGLIELLLVSKNVYSRWTVIFLGMVVCE